MKVFVMGDIHGAHKALVQCLERSGFDKENDLLIQLGDVVDGWSGVYECVEELLTIKHLEAIRGNHDEWFRQWLITKNHPCGWLQGGEGTLRSYCNSLKKEYMLHMSGCTSNLLTTDIPLKHLNFFLKRQQPYYERIEKLIPSGQNYRYLFVHGGFNRHHHIDDLLFNTEDVLMWDRDLWMAALSYGQIEPGDEIKYPNRPKFRMKDDFKEVFIGHTTTINWKTDKPIFAANIWNLDTGAGFHGKLTIMDFETKEYWQSDPVRELYPNETGR